VKQQDHQPTGIDNSHYFQNHVQNENDNKNSMDVDNNLNNITNNEKKVNLIGTCEEWVEVFDTLQKARDNLRLCLDRDVKIEEYQIQNSNGILILDLSNQNNINENNDCKSIRSYILDHGFSGYLMNGQLLLYQPFSYWRLVDDDKKKGISQCLIKDMFLAHSICENTINFNSTNANNQNVFNVNDDKYMKCNFEF